MTNRLSRRVFVKLASAASGAIIVGFDPLNHSWVTQAQVRTTPFQKLPKLDGVLLYDEAACLAFATDRGNLVHRRPVAVLRPGSIRDVVTMIHYANKHSLKIAMRGQGHSQYGQALVEAGVIIDSTTLNNIHSINPEVADVQCGVSLGQLATATLAKGLILPVLPDGMMLTVGGVLCVGGHGKTSHHFGAMVDQVTELDVCTGAALCPVRLNTRLNFSISRWEGLASMRL